MKMAHSEGDLYKELLVVITEEVMTGRRHSLDEANCRLLKKAADGDVDAQRDCEVLFVASLASLRANRGGTWCI